MSFEYSLHAKQIKIRNNTILNYFCRCSKKTTEKLFNCPSTTYKDTYSPVINKFLNIKYRTSCSGKQSPTKTPTPSSPQKDGDTVSSSPTPMKFSFSEALAAAPMMASTSRICGHSRQKVAHGGLWSLEARCPKAGLTTQFTTTQYLTRSSCTGAVPTIECDTTACAFSTGRPNSGLNASPKRQQKHLGNALTIPVSLAIPISSCMAEREWPTSIWAICGRSAWLIGGGGSSSSNKTRRRRGRGDSTVLH